MRHVFIDASSIQVTARKHYKKYLDLVGLATHFGTPTVDANVKAYIMAVTKDGTEPKVPAVVGALKAQGVKPYVKTLDLSPGAARASWVLDMVYDIMAILLFDGKDGDEIVIVSHDPGFMRAVEDAVDADFNVTVAGFAGFIPDCIPKEEGVRFEEIPEEFLEARDY